LLGEINRQFISEVVGCASLDEERGLKSADLSRHVTAGFFDSAFFTGRRVT